MIKFKNVCRSLKNLWFFSDPHYNHLNICLGTTKWEGDSVLGCRNFNTLDEMNYQIVKGINDYVKEDDILVCCGDWSFQGIDSIKKFRDLINCKTIHLIQGNH